MTFAGPAAIERIDRKNGQLPIVWRDRRPDASAIVTRMLTMPYHLVTTERFDGPVRFSRAR